MEKRISALYPFVKDCYIINDKGEIINTNTQNKIKTFKDPKGYHLISLMKKGGKTTCIPYYRLLMMAFNPVNNMHELQVNHIDGNKDNNSLNNLEWVTSQENIQHAWRTSLSSAKNIQGEKSNFCNYGEDKALKVVELLKTHQYTDKEIAEMTNTNARNFVSRIRRKETWKHLTVDIDEPLGKPERKSFNKKGSTTIS